MECGLFDLFSLINYFHYKLCALQDIICLTVSILSSIFEKTKTVCLKKLSCQYAKEMETIVAGTPLPENQLAYKARLEARTNNIQPNFNGFLEALFGLCVSHHNLFLLFIYCFVCFLGIL